METWQNYLIITYAAVNFFAFYKGYHEVTKRKNPFGLAGLFNLFGIFVWGDAVVIGLFWFVASIAVFILNDWILFLLLLSVFWVIRGIGETIYWLNQQFANPEKNPPHTLTFYKIFDSDAIWFVYQVIWQCISVVAIIMTIYFTKLWLAV